MTSTFPFKIFVIEDNECYGEFLVHRPGQNPNHSMEACGDMLPDK